MDTKQNEMPPLPEGQFSQGGIWYGPNAYTADQMRSYARAHVATERAKARDESLADAETACEGIRNVEQNAGNFEHAEGATFCKRAIATLRRASALQQLTRESEEMGMSPASSGEVAGAKVPLTDPWVTAVRMADHMCPLDLSSPDRWRWKAAYMRNALSPTSPLGGGSHE